MKALSLTQPMAWAIFHGKDVENRSWSTKFRGRVMIHASKGFDKEHYRWIVDNDNRLVTGGVPPPWEFVHGAIIGEVDITKVIKRSGEIIEPGQYGSSMGNKQRELGYMRKMTPEYFSHWFFGPYGFVLANPVLYDKPIPCKGQLGFFEPDI